MSDSHIVFVFLLLTLVHVEKRLGTRRHIGVCSGGKAISMDINLRRGISYELDGMDQMKHGFINPRDHATLTVFFRTPFSYMQTE